MNGYESLGYNIYPHLLTNFSIQYLPIYEKTIAEFERRHPEWKDTIYINDDVRDIKRQITRPWDFLPGACAFHRPFLFTSCP